MDVIRLKNAGGYFLKIDKGNRKYTSRIPPQKYYTDNPIKRACRIYVEKCNLRHAFWLMQEYSPSFFRFKQVLFCTCAHICPVFHDVPDTGEASAECSITSLLVSRLKNQTVWRYLFSVTCSPKDPE